MNAFPSVCGQSRHRSGRRHWRAGPILGSAGGRGCATGTTSVRQDDVMPSARRAKPPARAWWREVSWRMLSEPFGTRRRTDTDEQTESAGFRWWPRRCHPSAVLDVAVRHDELLVDEAHLATLADSEPVVVAVDALALGEADDGDLLARLEPELHGRGLAVGGGVDVGRQSDGPGGRGGRGVGGPGRGDDGDPGGDGQGGGDSGELAHDGGFPLEGPNRRVRPGCGVLRCASSVLEGARMAGPPRGRQRG